jgi:hypothetical protein
VVDNRYLNPCGHQKMLQIVIQDRLQLLALVLFYLRQFAGHRAHLIGLLP